MARNDLSDVDLDEISLVDSPASKGARIVLWKRDADGADELSSRKGRGTMSNKTEDVGFIRRLMKNLGVGAADLVAKAEDDDVTNAELEKQVADLTKSVGDISKSVEALTKSLATATPDPAAEARKAFGKKLPKALQPGYEAMDDEEKDEFAKSFAPAAPVAKAAGDESLRKENAELRGRLDKIEGSARKTELRSQLAKCEGLVDLTAVVDQIAKQELTDPAGAAIVIAQLKAAGERVSTADLFKSIGRDGAASPDSAVSKLATAVQKYRAAHPEATAEKAEAEVLKANPALYDAYLDENPAQRGAAA